MVRAGRLIASTASRGCLSAAVGAGALVWLALRAAHADPAWPAARPTRQQGYTRPLLELQLVSGLAAPVAPREGGGTPWWGAVAGATGLVRLWPEVGVGLLVERSVYAWYLDGTDETLELFAWQLVAVPVRFYFRRTAPADPYVAVAVGQAWPATTVDGVHGFWGDGRVALQLAFGLDWYRAPRMRLGGAVAYSIAGTSETAGAGSQTPVGWRSAPEPPELEPGISIRFGGTFGALHEDVGLRP